MAAGDVTYQVVAFSHGGTAIGELMGYLFRRIVQFLPVVYADNVYAQVMPIQGRQVEAESSNLAQADELTQGAKGTISATAKQADGGTTTFSCTNMLVGNITNDLNNPPFVKTMEYINEGTPVFGVTV